MRLYNKIREDESGFTLLEIMAAMVVCVLAMLGVLGANTIIHQTTEEGYEKSVVAQDMNEVIEQMRDAANSSGEAFQSQVIVAANAAVESVTSLSSEYDEDISVSYEDVTADPLDVTITASWNLRGVRSTTTSMRALITRRT